MREPASDDRWNETSTQSHTRGEGRLGTRQVGRVWGILVLVGLSALKVSLASDRRSKTIAEYQGSSAPASPDGLSEHR